MGTFTKTETKEVEYYGVRVVIREEVSQTQGAYDVRDLYCKNCNKDLTRLLWDEDVKYCPHCGLDLIGNRIPTFAR